MATLFKRKQYINMMMLLRVIGWLLMIESGFMIFPIIAGIVFHEAETLKLLMALGITLSCGYGLTKLRPKSLEMGKREAILLTALIWVVLSLFGMLPYLLIGVFDNVTDAFFETMSAFTTTGFSLIDSIEGVPHSLLLWRCVTQWIGGLGIILFTLAVVPMLNYQGGMQMFNAEVTGITHEKLTPRVSSTAKGLWLIYIVLTFMVMGLLFFSSLPYFDSICYALSLISTAGFSISESNIEACDTYYVKGVMILFMFFASVNFSLIYQAVHHRMENVRKNTTFKCFCCWILGAYILLCVNIIISGSVDSVADLTIEPLFQAMSFASSAGIVDPDFTDWGPLAIIVMTILIFTGACAGSTSGGAKIDRITVLAKFLKNEFYKIIHPSAITTVQINGKGMNYVIVQKTLGFLFLYILIILGVIIALVTLGIPLQQSFYYSLSSISNCGIGPEISGIASSVNDICNPAKWILAIEMLTGRLEIYTVLLLFTGYFWRK